MFNNYNIYLVPCKYRRQTINWLCSAIEYYCIFMRRLDNHVIINSLIEITVITKDLTINIEFEMYPTIP